jgi:cytochrome oxidase Cu insertion factor (SCO1/SenC/PrrC family)
MSFTRRYFLACAAGAAAVARAATVPRPAPDFTINLPNGGSISLKQYRGRPLAVAFISTT